MDVDRFCHHTYHLSATRDDEYTAEIGKRLGA